MYSRLHLYHSQFTAAPVLLNYTFELLSYAQMDSLVHLSYSHFYYSYSLLHFIYEHFHMYYSFIQLGYSDVHNWSQFCTWCLRSVLVIHFCVSVTHICTCLTHIYPNLLNFYVAYCGSGSWVKHNRSHFCSSQVIIHLCITQKTPHWANENTVASVYEFYLLAFFLFDWPRWRWRGTVSVSPSS